MAEKSKPARKPLEPWQVEDAKRLKKLVDDYLEDRGLSQAEFGETSGIGTQGLIYQYTSGKIPLNIAVAIKFGKALGCKIDRFSPAIAQTIREAFEDNLVEIPMQKYSPKTAAIADIVESMDDAGKDAVQEDVQKEKFWLEHRENLAQAQRKAG